MIETQIKESLLKLQSSIDGADGAGIRESMAEIDTALKEHRREIDAQLKHFLKNRSYIKALMYLNGESDIPKGKCSGRKDFS
ncbi:hypothetical protein [Pelagicoccus mobilis]|uniref:Uncharacterized protein n=1 Tax=Pelagicoccus mobilis TaxID=415221 RepID=A0A934RXW8_9BACT|nr:hypothetical protein [Pelagicoccus mobilis]MBK1876372.1 hypothetical protein [Pelagicoccus mobilis]